jgi:hypothetical protein
MKRLLLIVLPLLLMVGCEDKKDDTTEPVNPLISVYNLTSVSVSIQSNPVQTLTFNSDGTTTYMVFILGDDGVYSLQGKLDGEDANEGGTWNDTGNKLTLISSESETTIFDFTLSGNNLAMTISEPETEESYGTVITYNFTKD